MDLKDILWLAYKDLSEKKVRTALTIVMVVIGIAAIVALTSQTSGISASIQKQLSSLGPTSIIMISTKSTGFTAFDISSLQSLANVSSVVPIVEGDGTAISNGQNTSVTVIGISSNGLETISGGAALYQGALYADTLGPSSVVGYDVAFPTDLGGTQNIQVGEPITLRFSSGSFGGGSAQTITVPVSGIMSQTGSSIVPIDTSVTMSLQEAQTLLHKQSYNIVLVEAKNVSSVTALSNLITDIYGTNARIITTQQLLQTTASIIGSITLLLGVVAGISLLVASIGIMNVMLIAVYERTHEIGIMKSLGFKSRHILLIFVLQALIVGLIGGILGIGLGAGASYTLSTVLSKSSASNSSTTTQSSSSTEYRGAGAAGAHGGGVAYGGGGAGASPSSSASSIKYSPVFGAGMMLEALLIAIIVSVLAGIYPAWRASKMEPIDALRQL